MDEGEAPEARHPTGRGLMTGWRITIDMSPGSRGRIHDEVYTTTMPPMLLSDAVESALEAASLIHAEPGEGQYQITATPHFG